MKHEIIDALESSLGDMNGKEQLSYLKDIAEYLNNNGQDVAQKLAERISRDCILQSRCPDCFSKLEITTFINCAGEYFGSPAYERGNEVFCPMCGWGDK
ncbi:hypothetical protein SAMN00017405_0418 [Desulfonispora thiosulfatigenes DSM 11270]|uniref:Uncharacterized protein n=1 Tax=Desulfonispora thiosulfatigenes DSM 11270 TaxID=656914 RepID=A0A1W1VQM0_DESTI|nr:hypothetical protein [Desulfonispora thiosulfatigenes]SMB95520.1 hypothetical protein SAMN00017405_0418 [Desulfonispora thiosulfatigenes DSM 11270]